MKWFVLGALAMIAVAFAMTLGPADISFPQVLNAFAGKGEPMTVAIVTDLRMPRVVLAFLVGGSLAVTGATLQALVRNPLAEPYLLGLSGGAGLGASLAIALQSGQGWSVPVAATVGALAAIALVYRLAVIAGGILDTRILLFAGVVVGAFATAIMSAVLALSPAAELRNAMMWMLGGFDRASWRTVMIFVAYSALPLLILYRASRPLDLISLGEEPAQFLGIDVERLKRLLYLVASLLTAASVAVSGIIGFVGLVIPHSVRIIWGHSHRVLLPASFLLGGTLLVTADAAARTVFSPVELPVGAVTALVGVPVFAVLLRGWMKR